MKQTAEFDCHENNTTYLQDTVSQRKQGSRGVSLPAKNRTALTVSVIQRQLETIEMEKEYITSDKLKGVKYYSAAERLAFVYTIANGKLYNSNSEPLTSTGQPDLMELVATVQQLKVQDELTRELSEAETNILTERARMLGDSYIYVLGSDGTFYVTTQVLDRVHHSSLLEGAPVACAGHIKANAGEINMMSNQSGHYKPSIDTFYTTLNFLRNNHVDLAKIFVRLNGTVRGQPPENFSFRNAFDFIERYPRLLENAEAASQATDASLTESVHPATQNIPTAQEDPYRQLVLN